MYCSRKKWCRRYRRSKCSRKSCRRGRKRKQRVGREEVVVEEEGEVMVASIRRRWK